MAILSAAFLDIFSQVFEFLEQQKEKKQSISSRFDYSLSHVNEP